MKGRTALRGLTSEEVVAAQDFLSTIGVAGPRPVLDVILGQIVKTDATPANSLFEHHYRYWQQPLTVPPGHMAIFVRVNRDEGPGSTEVR